jgi:hypothetical protein
MPPTSPPVVTPPPESEDHPWTIQIPPHPKRFDSPEYVASRKKMRSIAASVSDFDYGSQPFEDHHGGGLWLKDAGGWFLVRNLAGIEWSAQFCADPAKVDRLPLNARRLYAAYPDVVEELGIRALLDTEIVDAAGVANWTDSICNAGVPLPHNLHVGVVPKQPMGGIHHYPTPITDIELIKRDDLPDWMTHQGVTAAVVPFGGHGRSRVLYASTTPPATEPSPIERIQAMSPAHEEAAYLEPHIDLEVLEAGEGAVILPADHPFSLEVHRRRRA